MLVSQSSETAEDANEVYSLFHLAEKLFGEWRNSDHEIPLPATLPNDTSSIDEEFEALLIGYGEGEEREIIAGLISNEPTISAFLI